MNTREEQISSISAVKDFSNNKVAEFPVDAEVCENGIVKFHYSNIGFQQSYNAGYMQHTVNLMWEYDNTQSEDFRERNLHGSYNTNFQIMSYRNGALIIEDGNITIYITKSI